MKLRIILFLLLISPVISAQQKWTLISHFSNQTILTPYFLNENYGFVLLRSDSTLLYRTINGGKSWEQIYIILYDNNYPYYVNFDKLIFDTPSHLYASSSFTDGLYESLDSGRTWKSISTWYGGGDFYYLEGVLYSY